MKSQKMWTTRLLGETMHDFGRIISAPTPKQQYSVMPCRGGYQPPDEKRRGGYQKHATRFVGAAISRPMKSGEKSSYINK